MIDPLDAPPVGGEERRLVTFAADRIDFARAVSELLVARGICTERLPLSELHRALTPEQMRLDDNYLNPVTIEFYRPDDALQELYRALIRDLAGVLPFDFVFQARPIFRFHFPVPFPHGLRAPSGKPIQFHSDTLGGHPYEMLNAWVPLTPCHGSAALQLATLAESVPILRRFLAQPDVGAIPKTARLAPFRAWLSSDDALASEITRACEPIAMDVGACLLFDARCLHGGTENAEQVTRVSLDFRIAPVEAHEQTLAQGAAGRFLRGDVFDVLTAKELCEADLR